MGLKQDSGARIESRRQSWDPDKTAELGRYGRPRTGLQQFECKTMTGHTSVGKSASSARGIYVLDSVLAS